MSGLRHGLLVLDKPAGLSSAQALAPAKRMLPRRTRVGHAGTLDPFATGVLLVLVGDGTRLSRLAMGLRKRYVATVRFGRATDTHDPEGRTVAEADPGGAAPAGIPDALGAFEGEIEQVPPAYSALKVDGQRAYRRARAGETVALAPRRVTVHRAALLDERWPEVEFELVCGTGTYVRAVARDLGAALGLPAHLSALRRTHVGPFAADDGSTPDRVDPARLVALETVVEAAGLPVAAVDPADALRFTRGAVVAAPAPGDGALVAVATRLHGRRALIGLAQRAGGGRLRPTTVLASARERLEDGEDTT